MFKFSKSFSLICFSIVLSFILNLQLGCTKKTNEKDNSLNVALQANVKGLDPIFAADSYSNLVVSHIFEGLLNYEYLKRPYQLKANLAESMPIVSADGLTYTFKIKKGILFQDNSAFANGKGRELVAADFIYSWKRLADPRNTADGFWIFDGKIKGLNEWADLVKAGKANEDTPIEGFQAPDKYTLIIKLNTPYTQLLSVLAMAYSFVVPKEAVQKYDKDFINNPVGTGPFKLVKWVRNSKITLEKNPSYHDAFYPTEGETGDEQQGLLKDAGKKIPLADKLVFTEINEDQPRWQNFMVGNFEFVVIPNDNFSTVIKNNKLMSDVEAKGFKLSISPGLDCSYIGFNMKDPLLGKNKLLRKAMAMAFDSNEFIKKFQNGRGVTAQGPIPPGIDSYDPSFINPNQINKIEKAKELLKQAGYPEGKGLPEILFETTADSKVRQHAEFFTQSMAQIGINIKISANSWPQLQDKIKNSQAQMFQVSWAADYPDAQNFFQLFYSKNVSPGPNDTGFSNPEFDAFYERSLKTTSATERLALYKKMRDLVVEESPWIFKFHSVSYDLYHDWLYNFKQNEVANDYLKYLRVDPVLRAKNKGKF
jgi:oligopeptide transport system substrate-binding protein